jgi:hypothetical protein
MKLFGLSNLVFASLFTQQLFQETTVDLDLGIDTTPFMTSTVVTKQGATGTKTEWNVYQHTAFPRYQLRTKQDVTLCDSSVKQVGFTRVFDPEYRTDTYFLDCWLFGCR